MMYVDREEMCEMSGRLECHAHILELAQQATGDCISHETRDALSKFSGEMAVAAKKALSD